MKYNLVGYGSLMSHKSLIPTLHKTKHYKPVIIKKYKRVFNLKTNNSGKYDYLNVEFSSKNNFNAILFSVDEKELRKIKERETDYNLEETLAYDFRTGKKLAKCLLCTDYLVGIDTKGNKPSKNYFILCREAAYHISTEFGKMWDETTFTAKGEKISEWIKKNKDYNTINIE